MDLLRSIRNLATRSKANKLSGIKFSKDDNALQVKMVVVGDSESGKTNLIWSLYRKTPWIGIGTPSLKYESNEAEVKTPHGDAYIALWDTAAHEDYDRLRPLIYPETGIVAFVFGIDDPDSLTNLEEKWKLEVDHFCPGVPKVVIGCKSDLRVGDGAKVNTQAGIELATRLGARHYIECSAQKYVGIEEVLGCVGSLAWELYQNKKEKRPPPTSFELSVTLPSEHRP
ncbi:GTP-binding protein Rho1 [Ceratobasidium sp. 428]|nr:GTP-binding protein Rho1 [Ceratobasidium sp. 395]KAG8783212.1 GTP-binding protein Rho1 [Ceratobasidium sp. 428]